MITVENYIRNKKDLDTDIVVICSIFNNTINIMPYVACDILVLDYELIDCYREDDGLIYLEISNKSYHDLIRRLNEINGYNS